MASLLNDIASEVIKSGPKSQLADDHAMQLLVTKKVPSPLGLRLLT
jgi:hypothetical protein